MRKNYLKVLFFLGIGLFITIDVFAQPKSVDKLIIGHPACISGVFARSGEQEMGGIKACVEWVNKVYGGVKIAGKKVPIEYKYYDCESKKESAASLIERLITVDKVNFIFAPYSSGLTLAGAPVAEKYGMVYMDNGGASDRIFQQGLRYIVQSIGPATRYDVGILDMIHKLDSKAKVALAYKDSEFSRMLMQGAEKRAIELGYKIVFKRTYPEVVTDLTPLLSDLKATKPDIVIGGGHYEDGMLFLRQMADMDIDVKALSLAASAYYPTYYKAVGGNLAEGVMAASHWEHGVTYTPEMAKKVGLEWIGPSQDEFVNLFKKLAVMKDLEPSDLAAVPVASVLALVKAIETANSLDSDKIRAVLGKLKFMSFYGVWQVDETGLQTGHSMVIVQWQGGKRVMAWPLEAQTGKLSYPMPTFAQKAKGILAVPK